MDSLDTDAFITAVESHPVLWDLRMPEYSSKAAKAKAWEEICETFDPEFAGKTDKEKNLAAVTLQKKWKSLRKSYNREKVKQKGCSGASKPRRQYVHYNQLSFLQPLAESRAPGQALNHEAHEEYVDTEESSDSTVTPDQKRIKKNDDAVPETRETLIENMKQEFPPIQYPDLYFLLSVFPHFNSIKEQHKLAAKADLIDLLRKYNNRIG